jgi:hypothetical protein
VHRELGYVELLRGEYPRATLWLNSATEFGDGDEDRALEAACTLAVGIENPHLHGLVDPDGPPLLEDLLGKARAVVVWLSARRLLPKAVT